MKWFNCKWKIFDEWEVDKERSKKICLEWFVLKILLIFYLYIGKLIEEYEVVGILLDLFLELVVSVKEVEIEGL